MRAFDYLGATLYVLLDPDSEVSDLRKGDLEASLHLTLDATDRLVETSTKVVLHYDPKTLFHSEAVSDNHSLNNAKQIKVTLNNVDYWGLVAGQPVDIPRLPTGFSTVVSHLPRNQ